MGRIATLRAELIATRGRYEAEVRELKRRLSWQRAQDGKRYTVHSYVDIGEASSHHARELLALTQVGAETAHPGSFSALMLRRDEVGNPLIDVVMEEDLPSLAAPPQVVDLTRRESTRYTPLQSGQRSRLSGT